MTGPSWSPSEETVDPSGSAPPGRPLGFQESSTASGGGVEAGLGRYQVRRKLGEGGMGEVFLAWDPHLGREVAIKTIKGSGLRLKRFEREGKAVASLRHDNIVAVHDVVRDGPTPFLVMEAVTGQTLCEFAQGAGTRELLAVLADVARAVDYAHQQGVLHRDLKPANVLVDPGGRAVVLDFGLARFSEPEEGTRLTRTGAVVGTPSYMSPEQVGGQSELVGPRSDVFALGVLAYECFTGELPFQGESLVNLAAQIVGLEPPPPSARKPSLPRALDAVVGRCLAKRPTDRYDSAGELAEALGSVVGSLSSGGAPGEPGHSSRWLAALVTLVLVVGTAGYFALGQTPASSRALAEHATDPGPEAPEPEAPEPEAPEPKTPEPKTPEPGAPEPEAPEPETPEPGAPEPEAPDPEAPDPEAPDPEAPDPEAPEPEAPEPEAPEPETPEPEAPEPIDEAPAEEMVVAVRVPGAGDSWSEERYMSSRIEGVREGLVDGWTTTGVFEVQSALEGGFMLLLRLHQVEFPPTTRAETLARRQAELRLERGRFDVEVFGPNAGSEVAEVRGLTGAYSPLEAACIRGVARSSFDLHGVRASTTSTPLPERVLRALLDRAVGDLAVRRASLVLAGREAVRGQRCRLLALDAELADRQPEGEVVLAVHGRVWVGEDDGRVWALEVSGEGALSLPDGGVLRRVIEVRRTCTPR
jgi:serine/threonine protein kinase